MPSSWLGFVIALVMTCCWLHHIGCFAAMPSRSDECSAPFLIRWCRQAGSPGQGAGEKQLAGRGKYEKVIDGVGKHIYAAFGSTKLRADWRHASDELRAVMWWLASGLCSSIDVYGMAFPHETGESHSRSYWSTSNSHGQSPWPGPQVSKKNAAMEMYAMHAAMRAGLLCIHTH